MNKSTNRGPFSTGGTSGQQGLLWVSAFSHKHPHKVVCNSPHIISTGLCCFHCCKSKQSSYPVIFQITCVHRFYGICLCPAESTSQATACSKWTDTSQLRSNLKSAMTGGTKHRSVCHHGEPMMAEGEDKDSVTTRTIFKQFLHFLAKNSQYGIIMYFILSVNPGPF